MLKFQKDKWQNSPFLWFAEIDRHHSFSDAENRSGTNHPDCPQGSNAGIIAVQFLGLVFWFQQIVTLFNPAKKANLRNKSPRCPTPMVQWWDGPTSDQRLMKSLTSSGNR